MYKFFLIFLININIYANIVYDLRKDFFHNVVEKQLLKLDSQKDIKEAIKQRKKQSILSSYDIKRYETIIIENIGKNNLQDNEYFSIVNIKKQIYSILLYLKDEDKFYLIGSDLISSGNKNREVEVKYGEDHYFDTPTGVFEVKKGWRSSGKFKNNKKLIQSYGKKDRFIYYFGKIRQKRYNPFIKGKKIKYKKNYNLIDDTLNFAIHSYTNKSNPYKLGQRASHGCVRMSDELNIFLDNNLVLHKNFFKNNKWYLKKSKKPENIKNLNIKGSYLFIVDK